MASDRLAERFVDKLMGRTELGPSTPPKPTRAEHLSSTIPSVIKLYNRLTEGDRRRKEIITPDEDKLIRSITPDAGRIARRGT